MKKVPRHKPQKLFAITAAAQMQAPIIASTLPVMKPRRRPRLRMKEEAGMALTAEPIT